LKEVSYNFTTQPVNEQTTEYPHTKTANKPTNADTVSRWIRALMQGQNG